MKHSFHLLLTLLMAVSLALAPLTAWAEEGRGAPGPGETPDANQEIPDDPEGESSLPNDLEQPDDNSGPDDEGKGPDAQELPQPLRQPLSAPPLETERIAIRDLTSGTPTGGSGATEWQYDHSSQALFLKGAGPYALFGDANVRVSLRVVADADTTVYLEGVSIAGPVGAAALDCNGHEITLYLEGTNGLSGGGTAALRCEGPAVLRIHGGAGDSLKASGDGSGAGIGGDGGNTGGTVYIHGGTVTATGYADGAGIGSGTVYIHGGTVIATSYGDSAGIGGSSGAAGGTVYIYGGTVAATSYSGGAGIGGSSGAAGGTVYIHGGTVTADGSGAGIGGGGGGNLGGSGGAVTITGNARVTARSIGNGAGIGAGGGTTSRGEGSTLTVNLNDGYLDATGVHGIDCVAGSTIALSNATLTAEGTHLGIRSSRDLPVTLHGGTMTATGYDTHGLVVDRSLTVQGSHGTLTATGGTRGLSVGDTLDPTDFTVTGDPASDRTVTFSKAVEATASSRGSSGGGSAAVAAATPLAIIPTHAVWTGGADGLPFTVPDGSPTGLLSVAVDGAVLDPAHYTVREGSAIVTLGADYLGTLTDGQYTLTLRFWSGTATATFEVRPAEAATPQPTGNTVNDNPSTGGPQGGAAPVALLLAALAVGALCAGRRAR